MIPKTQKFSEVSNPQRIATNNYVRWYTYQLQTCFKPSKDRYKRSSAPPVSFSRIDCFKPSKDRYKPVIQTCISFPLLPCFKPSKDRYKPSNLDGDVVYLKSFKPSKDRYKQENLRNKTVVREVSNPQRIATNLLWGPQPIRPIRFQTLKGSLQTLTTWTSM